MRELTHSIKVYFHIFGMAVLFTSKFVSCWPLSLSPGSTNTTPKDSLGHSFTAQFYSSDSQSKVISLTKAGCRHTEAFPGGSLPEAPEPATKTHLLSADPLLN